MPYVTKRKRRERPSRYNGDAEMRRNLLAGGLVLALLATGVVLLVKAM